MKEDRNQDLREVEEVGKRVEENVEGKLLKAVNGWIALCIFCAALSLSGSSLLPLPPKPVSGRKRRLLH